MIARPGNMDVQLDLLLDYASNVRLYPAFQRYFRESSLGSGVLGQKPSLLIPAGARDVPAMTSETHQSSPGFRALCDGDHVVEIAAAMREFLDANGVSPARRE